MSKLEDFKKFVSIHPELSDYVTNKKTTWQNLFELFDMYGEKESVWKKYINSSNEFDTSFDIKNLFKILKDINLDSLEENISSIQKAVNIVEEFTKPSDEDNKTKVDSNEYSKIDKIYGEDNEK